MLFLSGVLGGGRVGELLGVCAVVLGLFDGYTVGLGGWGERLVGVVGDVPGYAVFTDPCAARTHGLTALRAPRDQDQNRNQDLDHDKDDQDQNRDRERGEDQPAQGDRDRVKGRDSSATGAGTGGDGDDAGSTGSAAGAGGGVGGGVGVGPVLEWWDAMRVLMERVGSAASRGARQQLTQQALENARPRRHEPIHYEEFPADPD